MNQQPEELELRFVVLFHQYTPDDDREDHWDLMLEHEGVLLTWALAEKPAPGKSIIAKALDDHRIEYLHLEGEISHNRGSVSRCFSGVYRWKLNTVRHIAILKSEDEIWEVEFAPFDGDSVRVSVSSCSNRSVFA